MDQGKLKEAINHFETAIKLVKEYDPEHNLLTSELYNYISKCKEKTNEEIEMLQKAIEEMKISCPYSLRLIN